MNARGMQALVKLLSEDQALSSAVSARISWDDLEQDPPLPSITLRLLSSRVEPQLSEPSNLSNPLIELSAHHDQFSLCTDLLDLAVAALRPLYNRVVVEVGAPPQRVVFAGVRVTDVQQSPAPRERTYRKVALISVWQEE